MLTADEFELAYRRYMEDGGHSYDPYDITHAWMNYKEHPESFAWLLGDSKA